MLAQRLSQPELAGCDPSRLVGAVLLAPVRLTTGTLRKGTRLDAEAGGSLIAAARSGDLDRPLRLAWPGPDDLHEDEAARRLAVAAAGTGVKQSAPRQSRLDLVARWDGVLHVRTDALLRLNAIDSLEVFTLFHGQVVQAGQVVASVKVAPHLISSAAVGEGIQIACENGLPLVDVRHYKPFDVAAIVLESVSSVDLARFESAARMKVEALGSRFLGARFIAKPDGEDSEDQIRAALQELVLERRLPVILVGGVSAGDPLSPFYPALESLGGRVLRHGIPAHPGSMIWLAELAQSRLLGVPQCGMFTLATAADLVLPRLLTGERLTSKELAELAHGGVLTPEMRFRFPPYARDLEAPEG
ncbi:MAG TPA: hypothetical protein VGJ36_09110 [Gemmatimonadales bacterium]